MKKNEIKNIKHGLYRIWWRLGGNSLASVGSTRSGRRWFAATNWINPEKEFFDEHYQAIRKLTLIRKR